MKKRRHEILNDLDDKFRELSYESNKYLEANHHLYLYSATEDDFRIQNAKDTMRNAQRRIDEIEKSIKEDICQLEDEASKNQTRLF